MTSRNALLLVLTLTALLIVGGRLYSRKSASDFGGALSGSFSMLSYSGFADTDGLKAFFAEPEIKHLEDTTKRFSILGGGYNPRIGEVKKGLIYLSEQLALPQEKRFLKKPPTLRYLKIETDSSSDRGISDAADKLILDYRRQIL